MFVSRATILALTALVGCARETGPTSRRGSQSLVVVDGGTRPSASSAQSLPNPSPDSLDEALLAAYLDTPYSESDFERALAAASQTRDPMTARAWLYAATRRAPTSRLARVMDIATPRDRIALARALAGRDRTAGPTSFPPSLAPRGDDAWQPALASVVQRYALPLEPPPPALELLLGASFDDEVAGARLFGSPTVPLPDAAVIDVLAPLAIPALVRSLTGRTAPPELWQALLRRTAHAAHLSPRRWANAWRSVRDAVGSRPDLSADLAAAIAEASEARGLPPRTASIFRCENAAALDRSTGWPHETTRCAAAGFEAISLAAQARVVGGSGGQPAQRAAMLLDLVGRAQGDPLVLEAVCDAAAQLPVPAARGLFRRLATERDAGVLAALLDALLAHPQHARAMLPGERDGLLRAPFEIPNLATLEARVDSVRLASLLHAGDPAPARRNEATPRAFDLARQPDAGTIASVPTAAIANTPPVTLIVDSEAGRFAIELSARRAPRAVARIVESARAGQYDGVIFHRVVPGFVVQGGDPRGDGYGGSDPPVPTELSIEPFERATVGIPLAGLDTGGMQFFVVLADAPHLDGRYPWVGRVSQGMDVVDGIMEGDTIRHVSVETH